MIEQTITQLRELRLSGIANALVSQIEHPTTYDNLSFDERLQLLIDSEQQERTGRKQQRLLKAAKSTSARIKTIAGRFITSMPLVGEVSKHSNYRALWEWKNLYRLCIRSHRLYEKLQR